MGKIFRMITIIMALLFVLNGCLTPTSAQWRLCRQPNTSWVSDDGSIILSVDNEQCTTGTIMVNGESIEVFALEGMQRDSSMSVFHIDLKGKPINKFKDRCEYWDCSYKSEDKFVATVKETTYFEEGQKITFNKVAE